MSDAPDVDILYRLGVRRDSKRRGDGAGAAGGRPVWPVAVAAVRQGTQASWVGPTVQPSTTTIIGNACGQ